MKEIVTLMISVKMALDVGQITVQLHLDLTLILTVVFNQLLVMNFFVQLLLVEKMKEIAIIMVSVKTVSFVDQTTAQPHLDFTLKLIVVIIQLSEMKISVQFQHLVEKMKEIVILIMNVKMVLDVQAVQPVLDSIQI